MLEAVIEAYRKIILFGIIMNPQIEKNIWNTQVTHGILLLDVKNLQIKIILLDTFSIGSREHLVEDV